VVVEGVTVVVAMVVVAMVVVAMVVVAMVVVAMVVVAMVGGKVLMVVSVEVVDGGHLGSLLIPDKKEIA
jgi:hypothetical protein